MMMMMNDDDGDDDGDDDDDDGHSVLWPLIRSDAIGAQALGSQVGRARATFRATRPLYPYPPVLKYRLGRTLTTVESVPVVVAHAELANVRSWSVRKIPMYE